MYYVNKLIIASCPESSNIKLNFKSGSDEDMISIHSNDSTMTICTLKFNDEKNSEEWVQFDHEENDADQTDHPTTDIFSIKNDTNNNVNYSM
jgi:hypothetical protein